MKTFGTPQEYGAEITRIAVQLFKDLRNKPEIANANSKEELRDIGVVCTGNKAQVAAALWQAKRWMASLVFERPVKN